MLRNYLKIAWKVLLRRPFFTFVSLFGITFTLLVLMVATGLVDHVLHPAEAGSRFDRSLLVDRIRLRQEKRRIMSSVNYFVIDRYIRRMQLPEKIGILSRSSRSAVYVGDRRLDLELRYTDAGFWYIMDIDFEKGAAYDSAAVAAADNVAVITARAAREVFGRESAVGQYISTSQGDFRVVGVIPHESVPTPEQGADIYIPVTISREAMTSEKLWGDYDVLILVPEGMDVEVVRDEYYGIIDQLNEDYRSEFDNIECRAKTSLDLVIVDVFGEDSCASAMAFFGLFALLMILFMVFPAMNLVNLNVSRIIERSSEIGVRKAFGATSKTLVGQFVTENVVLTLIGGALALVLSAAVIHIINTSAIIPYGRVDFNLSVILYSVLICLFFGLFSGVYPAYKMSRLHPIEALRGVEG